MKRLHYARPAKRRKRPSLGRVKARYSKPVPRWDWLVRGDNHGDGMWPLVVGAVVAAGRWPAVRQGLWRALSFSRAVGLALVAALVLELLRVREHGLAQEWPGWGPFLQGLALWCALAGVLSRPWPWRAWLGRSLAAETSSAVEETLTPGLTWQPVLPPWQVQPSATVTGPRTGPEWGDERLPGALWDRIRCMPSGCWLWKRETNSSGYGSTIWRGRRELVHRLVWQALVGPIPDGCELDHLCRDRRCCRPDHLQPVTHAENCRRRGCGPRGKEPGAARTTHQRGVPPHPTWGRNPDV